MLRAQERAEQVGIDDCTQLLEREVFERDGGRCSYVDASGARCSETGRLEFHHLTAFAQGGEHTEKNLTLRCAAHNALAAEADFGREHMDRVRPSGPRIEP